MHFSFMMVITENHSGGTNTRRLQRICPFPRRSSLRCLLPSVYGLMSLSQWYRDLTQATAPCSDICIRLKLWHTAAHGQVPMTPPAYITTGSVLRILINAWTVDPTMQNLRAKYGRDRWTRWRTELNSGKSQAWTLLVAAVSIQLIHNSFVFFLQKERKKAKIISAIYVCHHSNVFSPMCH